MRLVLYIALNVIFNSFASVLIKHAVSDTLSNSSGLGFSKMVRLVISPSFLVGLVLFGLSLLAYSLTLQRMKLNVAYPLTVTLCVILVTIISKVDLKEPLTAHQIFGTLVVVSGVWLIVR